MLAELGVAQIGGGVNLVDIGASGELDPRWRPIEKLINLYAFEPNAEECEKLRKSPNNLHATTYLPYAISNNTGEAVLHLTKSLYCCSLLEPNLEWLRRFSCSELFEITGQQKVPTYRLDAVNELKDVDADVIKTDSQGLDMAILASGASMLDDAFMVETEPGFIENYRGENTYSQVDTFMGTRGFLLFDINLHRVSRRNEFASSPTGKEQIMWCEAIWLKDYIALDRRGQASALSREKALKSLLLCGLVGCPDFGYELAGFFHARGLLSGTELEALRKKEGWCVNHSFNGRGDASKDGITTKIVTFGLRFLPGRLRKGFAVAALRASAQPNLVRSMYRRLQSH